MSRGQWPAPRRIIDQAGLGWGGLWSLLYTAERAVAALALLDPLADCPDLRGLADRLRRAGGDLFEDYPMAILAAKPVDLGPIARPTHAPAARDMVVQLLSAVLRGCNELLSYDLDVEDSALLSRVNSAAWDVREDLTSGIAS